jgi:hypothetical protein
MIIIIVYDHYVLLLLLLLLRFDYIWYCDKQNKSRNTQPHCTLFEYFVQHKHKTVLCAQQLVTFRSYLILVRRTPDTKISPTYMRQRCYLPFSSRPNLFINSGMQSIKISCIRKYSPVYS